MRELLLAGTFVIAGCWTSSAPAPARTAAPADTSSDARTAGMLGGMAYGGLTYGGAFASLTGTGDISSGFDDPDIYGGLLGGDEPSGGFGTGGLGTGSGGGGTGWGTIGTGRYGTIGQGGGSGYGVGGGRLGRGNGPTARIGQPTAGSGLDKAIIRRYIKRNIQKIQYCYEKQLVSNPTLAGTLRVDFTITGAGLVTGATGSGLDRAVDACVAGVIAGIEFPKPQGGGEVRVSYPFTFQSAP